VPYHVRVAPTALESRRPDITVLDKSAFWIEEQIAAPRRQGSDIFIDGRVISWNFIDRIRIFETDDDIKGEVFLGSAADYLERWGRDVTEEFLTGPPGTGPRPEPDEATTFAANRKAVMVIYGHDGEANTALFNWLRAIGLQPREWSQLIRASGSASPYIGEVLDQAFRDAQAVIAFFTPDEHVTAAGSQGGQRTWRLQARPNVLIEAGMALVTHPTRTVLVVLGNQELPSDLAGRHYVRLNSTAVEPLHDLAERLHTAGCDTDTTGTAWLDPTRFPERNATNAPPDKPTPTARSQSASEAGSRARDEAPATKKGARKRSQRPRVVSSPDAALKVELLSTKWTLWQRASWLTDIQVRITNTTPNRVITLTRYELESDPGSSWDSRPKLTQEQVDSLFHEMIRRGEAYGPAQLRQMDLPPGDSRTGWFASHAYLPYPARKGKPYCEFTVTDDEGETYILPIPGQGPHASPPPHGLLRLRSRAIEGRHMRGRLPADRNEPVPDDELRRFDIWTANVGDALDSQPDYQAQFQVTRSTPATRPDSTEIVRCTETLEQIVRTLEGRRPI
jgi:predicted nucleotide-binding protein